MKKITFLSAAVLIASTSVFNSCKKKTEVDNETQSVVDNAICEQQFMAIQPSVNSKGITEKGIKKVNTCETWNILGAIGGTNTPNPAQDTIVNGSGNYQNGPVTFEIDYGTTGCPGPDGRIRTGKIHITTAKRWSSLNTQVTTDLLNYAVNGVTYSGQVIITRIDSVTINTQVVNGHCTNGTWNIDWACNKTLKQIAGFSTKTDETDDEFQITGTANGKNREGRTFTTSITSPLVKKNNCQYISSGTLELTPDGFKTRTVDFGNGTCDDDATFTVNGQTVSFKLK
ncbi:MAG: hypothetical protein JST26_05150 [Bacteroidetes bacterium]|nr:hypothetical protein [Bacteroidota bacterium]